MVDTSTKPCRKCHIEKPLAGFYRHKKMSDGYLNFCIQCVKQREKKRYAENKEKINAYDRDRSMRPDRVAARVSYLKTPKGKQIADKAKREWIERNKAKRDAHNALSNAIKRGKLSPLPCIVCGSPHVHGHHVSYDLPLAVSWLCPKHHSETHKSLRYSN